MTEYNNNKLLRSLENLPEKDPPANSWEKLRGTLDFEDAVGESLLEWEDHHEFKEDVWKSLEMHLQADNPNKGEGKRRILMYAIAVAATLLFSLFVYWGYFAEVKYEVTYAEVVVEEQEMDNMASDVEAEKFIKQVCALQTEVCNNPEYKALKSQLSDLDQEMEQLDHMLEANEKNPYLLKAKGRVQLLKADVTRKIISIITS
ncbi:hypothetical protein LVD15_16815 [Fulvivirga maritima]|uniref:hypothetical protein n=1 Tax=Fulvivirga maritima TaxID=2904247 RepID=UPI001F179199|nr:hypothetical protein [Fulvivirga maritima]UII24963.1 hypothetical protein LVD15_16815 [Fulvivirga maritima]